MSKQVKSAAMAVAMAGVEAVVSTTEQNSPQEQRTRNLFVKVDTFNVEGRTIGTRIVDLFHFGTAAWFQKHMWWAMHNQCTVESKTAETEEIEAYIVAQKAALAERYNAA